MPFISIMIGGAVGSSFRYLLNLLITLNHFPFDTFIANVIGSLLLGYLTTFPFKLNNNLKLFFKVGLLGSFTTFSTFSHELFSFFKNDNFLLAFIYFSSTVMCSFLFAFFGIFIGNKHKNILRREKI